jgi:uncharacterized protein YcbK (DUF882 family)
VPISPACNARLGSTVDRVLRSGQHVGLAALVLLFGCNSLQNAVANGDTRSLSFRHTHTNEELTVTYKLNGRYDDEALKKINWVMRDWRRNESIRMDPQVIDAVWELYRDVGATQPIEIICGYRAPATNSMLRQRSGGVARFSQHMLGKAIDLHISGVSLEAQREAAMRLHRGGVGYYPSSTFIHVDVASIRHWPRMSYDQLSRVFPNGRTVHIPSNGRPLPGYQLALADISKRGRAPSQMSLDAARVAGIDVSTTNQRPNLLASLFGGARDAEEDEDATRGSKSASKAKTRAGTKVASASNAKREQKADTRRTEASANDEADKPIMTASAEGSVPSPRSSPTRASAPEEQIASTAPWPLREEAQTDRVPIELALAYAAEPVQRPGPSVARAAAIGGSLIDRARPGAESAERIADNGPVTVVKKTYARLTADAESTVPTMALHTAVPVTAGMRFDDPWLRAAMFAPSLYTSLTTSFYGEPDYTELRPLMHKPAATIVMTFSEDPLNGLTCEHFNGGAVVFLATVTFKRTASLRLQ